MHLVHPVAQAVPDEPPYDRAVGVHRVAGARVVRVARPVVVQQVVLVVGQAAERERGPLRAPFRGVVVGHVQDHLQACPVESLDQVAELIHGRRGARPAGVLDVRGEERDGLVAPVVGSAGRRRQDIELEDRQEFHSGDPEVHQVRDLLDEPGVGPAQLGRNAGTRVRGESSQVSLVDDRLAEGPGRRPVPFPVVRARVDDDALHRDRTGGRLAGMQSPVADRDGGAPPVRIQQDPGRVEALPVLRRPRAVRGEPVKLARPQVRHEDMPVVAGPVEVRVQGDDGRGVGPIFDIVEEEQVQPGRPPGVHGEVDAARHDRRPERVADPGVVQRSRRWNRRSSVIGGA